jgi:hypothetical protein
MTAAELLFVYIKSFGSFLPAFVNFIANSRNCKPVKERGLYALL